MLRIATCAESDIDALERHRPSGRNDVHAYHFGRQQTGETEYLVAWADDVAVGSIVITWAGFRQDAPRWATNPGATRLYERLGYRDTGIRCESRYTWYDDEGIGHEMVETDRYLVRSW